MDGTLYRALVVVVCSVGLLSGLTYLCLYHPSRWRSPLARDASAWVLALTLFFAWSLYRAAYAMLFGPAGEPVGLVFAATSLMLGVALVAVVAYRLARFVAAAQQERDHPTMLCTHCLGLGVVPRKEAST